MPGKSSRRARGMKERARDHALFVTYDDLAA